MFARCGLIACILVLCSGPAWGQGNCSLQNLAGKYATARQGASLLISGVLPDNMQWGAAYVPFAAMGVLEIRRDGTVESRGWTSVGVSTPPKVEPNAVNGTLKLNDDCSGVITIGDVVPPIKEIVHFLDNGRELRLLTQQSQVPTLNWLGKGYRIQEGTCHQNQLRGSYLLQCSVIYPGQGTTLAGGSLNMTMDVGWGGSNIGKMFGRVGPQYAEFPFAGKVIAREDCTIEATNTMGGIARGVLYDGGKRGFFMPLGQMMPNGTFVPQPYGICDISLVERK